MGIAAGEGGHGHNRGGQQGGGHMGRTGRASSGWEQGQARPLGIWSRGGWVPLVGPTDLRGPEMQYLLHAQAQEPLLVGIWAPWQRSQSRWDSMRPRATTE